MAKDRGEPLKRMNAVAQSHGERSLRFGVEVHRREERGGIGHDQANRRDRPVINRGVGSPRDQHRLGLEGSGTQLLRLLSEPGDLISR